MVAEISRSIIRDIVDLIAKNYERNEIITHCMEVHKKSYASIYKYYLRALADINSDISEKIEHIRNKKIKGLQRDLREAYVNYEKAIIPDIKIKWFNIYLEVKEQLNQYYPNALKHEKEIADFSININFLEVDETLPCIELKKEDNDND